MLGIYKFISGTLSGKGPKEENLSKFHFFSNLPPELRLKIWRHALPERTLEASVRFENQRWMCAHSATPLHPSKNPDRRRLPELFSVNVEARELCLKEYVPFAKTYIHPTLDFLYISWYWGHLDDSQIKFYPIEGQPLNKFQRIAMTIGRNPNFAARFGALVDCLQRLGTPEELLLSLVGPRLPSVHSVSKGYSISNGNSVALLDWPHTVESNMAQEVRLHVMTAIETEQEHSSDFKMPQISQKLYYIYSGP